MKYVGAVSGEVGFSHLVRCRLEVQLHGLETTESKVCSLIVDEMKIRQKLKYSKEVHLSVTLTWTPSHSVLFRNLTMKPWQIQSCVFCSAGLHARYKIPVGYFFTKGCTEEQLAEVSRYVIQTTTYVGINVICVVTDSHRINVAAMQILPGAEGKTCSTPC
ncbi:hypothetical protein HPB48_009380 [Haemaphysalis longicornis]|uniref:Transposable element P transposase-like RNase H domain-containing protein n=1 Tax=Haemaphysalis longicornis TaxID=44386 RepID=A0A9J6FD18_HAELO|nr:hypothetical protein HPB48_009380 [Haemaphysalis longicornis]